MANKKSQCYAFTCYPQEGDLEKFQALEKVDHLLLSEEICPTTGNIHWQGCIRWDCQRTWTASVQLGHMNWSNYEKCNQRYEYNIRYCLKGLQSHEEYTKMGTNGPNYGKDLKIILERGTRPWTQQEKGESQIQRYKRNIDAVLAGKIDEVDADILGKGMRNLEYGAQRLHEFHHPAALMDGIAADHFEWHYGVSDSGKSHYVRKLGAVFIWLKKPNGAQWNTYDYQETVVFQDVDHTTCPSPYEVKNWFDLDPFLVDIKWGTKHIRPKRMIVTSQESIEECFPDWKGEHLKAMKRRFKIYHWPEPYCLEDGTPNPDWYDPTLIDQDTPGPEWTEHI